MRPVNLLETLRSVRKVAAQLAAERQRSGLAGRDVRNLQRQGVGPGLVERVRAVRGGAADGADVRRDDVRAAGRGGRGLVGERNVSRRWDRRRPSAPTSRASSYSSTRCCRRRGPATAENSRKATTGAKQSAFESTHSVVPFLSVVLATLVTWAGRATSFVYVVGNPGCVRGGRWWWVLR